MYDEAPQVSMGLRAPRHVVDGIRELAKQEKRSFNNMTRVLLEEAIEHRRRSAPAATDHPDHGA